MFLVVVGDVPSKFSTTGPWENADIAFEKHVRKGIGSWGTAWSVSIRGRNDGGVESSIRFSSNRDGRVLLGAFYADCQWLCKSVRQTRKIEMHCAIRSSITFKNLPSFNPLAIAKRTR